MVLFVCLYCLFVLLFFLLFLPCGSSSLYIANHWLPGRTGTLEFPQLLTFLVQKIPFTQKSNVGVSFDKGKIFTALATTGTCCRLYIVLRVTCLNSIWRWPSIPQLCTVLQLLLPCSGLDRAGIFIKLLNSCHSPGSRLYNRLFRFDTNI